MLKYFRNKKWLIDQINEYRDRTMRNIQTIHDLHEANETLGAENTKLKFRTNYSNSQEIVIQELEAKNKLLNEKNLKLSGDIGKAFSDICDLHNVIEELQAENLGLLNRIANEPQSHDPDLKIDLTKPIRRIYGGDLRTIRLQKIVFTYKVFENGFTVAVGLPTEEINQKYENYEPLPVTAETGLEKLKEAFKDCGTKLEDTGLSIKPKMDFVNVKANEPSSIKNIVPKKEKIKSYVPNIKPGNENTEVEWVEIIDMTNKSKAVRRLMSDILFSIHNRFVYEENGYLLSDLSVFPDETFLSYNVTRDNVRKMMKNYIDNGLIKKGVNGDYLAAKPIKIMLEKEK